MADRLRLEVGDDRPVIDSVGQRREVSPGGFSQRTTQRRLRHPGELSHRRDAQPSQLFSGLRSDPPQRADLEGVEKGAHLPGPHHRHTAAEHRPRRRRRRLGGLGGEFGEELVRRNPDRTGQSDLVEDALSNGRSDARSIAEGTPPAGDVEKRLVERQRFDQRCHLAEDGHDLSTDLAVATVTTGQEHRLGASTARQRTRHRRVHAIGAGLIGGSRDDPSGTRRPHHHRTTAQRRVIENLHRRKEGIHVDVQDHPLGRTAIHGRVHHASLTGARSAPARCGDVRAGSGNCAVRTSAARASRSAVRSPSDGCW